MKLGSIFASVAGSSGGNSTTRIAVPLSGGDRPIRLAALSSLKESAGGEESVIQRLAAGLPEPPGLSVTRLSNSTTALLLASRPVTTRRTSAAGPLEHASRTMARDQNALRIIASSRFLWNAVDLTARVRDQQDIDDDRGWTHKSRLSGNRWLMSALPRKRPYGPHR